MLARDNIIKKAIEAIMTLNDVMAQNVAMEALEAGIEPEYVIEEGFYAGINRIEEMFKEGKIFLPHMIAAAEAMEAGVRVLIPSKENMLSDMKSKGTVIIGTIEGDIHSIGKDIVATSLQIDGYEVINLGVDVPVETFIEKSMSIHPDIVATSALMTITMTNQLTLEKELKEAGIRDSLKTVVGGTPVTPEWAQAIGADIYGSDASDVVRKVNMILGSKKRNECPPKELLAVNASH
ncbi:methyltransferase cognate corrinoid protein [Methanolobus mangrovi]|uniref:Methyltransferase cognate corrinoid protein n=1 Tax=Methanolobus mangrovi TaxID=3072977 RepID=A0AA51YGX1_9EURY|nr:methyltransferase cognate corrinoid protein [Methanolobus mangrovi]WMW22516.1 methyltransferase cognate corrinoid protein [Methanolobus mangrovi]